MLLGVSRAVDMKDGEQSPLPRSWIARAREDCWAIEPSLDGPIRFSRTALFECRVHARQVGRIRLRRPHVLRGMLKGVDINGQAVHSSVPVIPELPRQNFIEQALARVATAG